MEYKMLYLFCKNPKQILTRQRLLERLWDADENYVDEHTLTTSISRIRGKIEADGDTYIKTIYGIGYQWMGGGENESGADLCKKDIPADMRRYGGFHAGHLCQFSLWMTGERWVLIGGGLLMLCALAWMFLLTVVFSKRLSVFTRELCRAMDQMISGSEEPIRAADRETLLPVSAYRLSRLYDIMQENRRKVDEERQELQMLVSDVSHQVKTPVSNLKMVTDTLLSKPVTEEERREFLQGIRNQTDKLEFLFQALVKTSRLETGAIRLEKKDAPLIDTLAMACSGIVYAAEKKIFP